MNQFCYELNTSVTSRHLLIETFNLALNVFSIYLNLIKLLQLNELIYFLA